MASIKKQRADRLAFEIAANGRPQAPGVAPATLKDIASREAQRPMRGGNADLQHGGIFGDGFKQRELF